MTAPRVPGVKICGIKDPERAEAASRAGADYVGVVFAGGPRHVTAEQAAPVVSALGNGTQGVGVFVDAAPEKILRYRDAVGFQIAQLAGSEAPETCGRLRMEGVTVWKGIRPLSSGMLHSRWEAYREVAGAVVVEGFSPEAPGGAGASFPYEWLEGLDRKGALLVLAGGLDARNVECAIRATRPNVVDVSSGVEQVRGEKSQKLISGFLEAVRAGCPEGGCAADAR